MNTISLKLMLSFCVLLGTACGDGGNNATNNANNANNTNNGNNTNNTQVCVIEDGADAPDFLQSIGCEADYDALSSEPISTAIPGARSTKVVFDRIDSQLYFQHTVRFPIHHEFCSEYLSGGDKPIVGDLSSFNATEYYSPERRFALGSLSYYTGPDIYVLEFSPYDTVDATLAKTLFDAVQEATPFTAVKFHPTSEAVARNVADANLPTVTTDELFADIDYQPLNLATSVGKLRFVNAADLETTYLDFRDIVVLDKVPNDISVVLGIITQEFQTPLAHINVLSQNRGTPNMALRNALQNEELLELEGEFVELTVGAFEYTVKKVTQEEADAWFEANRPETVEITSPDLSVTEITRIADVLDPEVADMRDRIREKIPAFGGKASHYAELATIEGVNVPDGFSVPIYFYDQHMKTHGLDEVARTLIEDPKFETDAEFRATGLESLRDQIKAADVDPALLASIEENLEAVGLLRGRFRSSTNAEDLDGFTGAGLYTSKSGEIGSVDRPIADAVRKVWASVWFLRAVDERRYRGIDHLKVGMALLVHRSFPDEYANGVALTGNPFDPSGLEPAFYINVQRGEASVVKPEPGVKTDQLLYHYDRPGQPAVYLDHSSEVPEGTNVLSASQLFALGTSLNAIHLHFATAYQTGGFYAMDVEFKFDIPATGGDPELFVKQARPHPGRGQ